MGRAERIVGLVAWTILASFLFMGFGMVLGEAVALTVEGVGLAARAELDLVVHVVRVFAGLAMLAVSRLYRMLAEQENAGSLAAWLAGWALVLYSGARVAALVDEQAAPVVLVVVLAGWALWRISHYFAHYDVDEEESTGEARGDPSAGGVSESFAEGGDADKRGHTDEEADHAADSSSDGPDDLD